MTARINHSHLHVLVLSLVLGSITWFSSEHSNVAFAQVSKTVPESLQKVKAECDAGNGNSCFRLGFEYEYRGSNQIVKWNPAEAIRLYNRACDLGDLETCVILGHIYLRGESHMQKDIPLGRKYIADACRHGLTGDSYNEECRGKVVPNAQAAPYIPPGEAARNTTQPRTGKESATGSQPSVTMARDDANKAQAAPQKVSGPENQYGFHFIQESPEQMASPSRVDNTRLEALCHAKINGACRMLDNRFDSGMNYDVQDVLDFYKHQCMSGDVLDCYKTGRILAKQDEVGDSILYFGKGCVLHDKGSCSGLSEMKQRAAKEAAASEAWTREHPFGETNIPSSSNPCRPGWHVYGSSISGEPRCARDGSN